MRTGKVSYEGKYWNEKPERHQWSRFSFAELIDKGILRQKYAIAWDRFTHHTSIEYLELIEANWFAIFANSMPRPTMKIISQKRNATV